MQFHVSSLMVEIKCFWKRKNESRRACSCMALYISCQTILHYIKVPSGFPFCQKLCGNTFIFLYSTKSVPLISLLHCRKVNGECGGFLNIWVPLWTNALQVLPFQLTAHQPTINLIHLHLILINFSTYSIFCAAFKGEDAPWT